MGFLGGKRYERECALGIRSRIRVFSLSAFLPSFWASKKKVARGRNPVASFEKKKSGAKGFALCFFRGRIPDLQGLCLLKVK